MKKLLWVTACISGIALCADTTNNHTPIAEFNTYLQEKTNFIQKNDKLKLLQRIATICKRLQEVCQESQTICKERRFALDRELGILIQLYLKELNEGELEQLKKLIKGCHDTLRKISTDPALSKEFSQRQKNYIELIFI